MTRRYFCWLGNMSAVWDTVLSVFNALITMHLLCLVLLLLTGAAPIAARPTGSSYLSATGEWEPPGALGDDSSGVSRGVYCYTVSLLTRPSRLKHTDWVHMFDVSAGVRLAWWTLWGLAIKVDIFVKTCADERVNSSPNWPQYVLKVH